MAKSRVSIRILPDEYAAFLADIPNDERLPGLYDVWVSRRSDEDARHRANGEDIRSVIVSHKEFNKYCMATAMKPSHDILMALAVAKAAGLKQ